MRTETVRPQIEWLQTAPPSFQALMNHIVALSLGYTCHNKLNVRDGSIAALPPAGI